MKHTTGSGTVADGISRVRYCASCSGWLCRVRIQGLPGSFRAETRSCREQNVQPPRGSFQGPRRQKWHRRRHGPMELGSGCSGHVGKSLVLGHVSCVSDGTYLECYFCVEIGYIFVQAVQILYQPTCWPP